MSEGHARLGPSNHRWPHCPGSVREEAVYPDIAGMAAIDGTGSHLLLEMCLINNVRADAYDMQVIGAGHKDSPNGWLVDRERCERVQMCLDYVARRVRELKEQFAGAIVTVEAESQSNPGGMFGRDDWWGTCDITITVTHEGRCLFIEVCDYKDGRGYVSAVDNTQLISYLGGRMREFIASGPQKVRPLKADKVGGCRVSIVQPKTTPPVRYDNLDPFDVVDKLFEMEAAAYYTDRPDAPLIPDGKNGKGYCQWCKHKPNCTAVSSAGIEAVKVMTNVESSDGMPLFAQLENAVANVLDMDAVQLADLADTEAAVSAIYLKIKNEIQRRVEQGLKVPGYAMAPGNSSRVWNADEETIAKALRGRKLKKEEIYPSSLISPAQVLKLSQLNDDQKKRIEKELITTKAGRMSLKKVAREADDTKDVNAMFADVLISHVTGMDGEGVHAASAPHTRVPVSPLMGVDFSFMGTEIVEDFVDESAVQSFDDVKQSTPDEISFL